MDSATRLDRLMLVGTLVWGGALGCGSVTGMAKADAGHEDVAQDVPSGGGGAGQSGGAGGTSAGAGGSGTDAGPDGNLAEVRDANPDSSGGPCLWNQPFGAPALATAFNTAQRDDAVWISNDGLTAYVSSDRTGGPGGFDIFTSVRPSIASAWGAFSALRNVNGSSNDRSPVLSPDGLTLFFYSDRNGSNDIYVSTRATVLADFSVAATVAGVNTTGREDTASITADGRTLYFDSNVSGNFRIYRATQIAGGGFTAPEEVGELNSAGADNASPVISADGLTIYFSRSAGQYDIFVAHRSTSADGFGAPTAVSELNSTTGIDGVSWLAPDACTVYFVSDRAGPAGNYDLYVATRRPL